MKLAAISMIRDEADIVGLFLRHLAALFDLVFLADQRSSDGTSDVIRQACEGRPGWSHWHMDFAGRHQKEITSLFMMRAFDAGADAVFFLDCDEFLDVRSRAELDDAAARMNARAAVGLLPWKPCVPVKLNHWPLRPRDKYWVAKEEVSNPKVAVPKSLHLAMPGLTIAQGSHRALDHAGKAIKTTTPIGSLLHIAVRSRQQFLQKVFISAIANLAKNNPMTMEGRHKRQFLEVIADRNLSDMDLTSIGAQFPMLDKPIAWWTHTMQIKHAGFEKRRLEIPLADLDLLTPAKPDLARLMARCLAEYRLENIHGGEGTLVQEGNTFRFQPAQR